MRVSIASLALAGMAAANPMPQAVTSAVAPKASAPAGCATSYSGTFEIEVVNATTSSKRSVQKRADQALTLTLANGVLKDSQGRTGYIASNQQFQFDGPPQSTAIYTAGWSVCGNGSLTLGASSVFYECLSGTFYNLYDENTAAQCSPIYLEVIAPSSNAPVASVSSDGQITASPVTICEYTDGQPQATGCAVTQISDGQIQATTGAPITQISDGQPQASTGKASSTAAPITQISDGQIQASTGKASSTAAPVTQISDGQIQASTGKPSSSAAAPVTQISDGQIQASTGKPMTTPVPVTQISDGQPQASKASSMAMGSKASTMSKASTTASSTSSATVQASTGGAVANMIRGEFLGLAAGVIAIAML